MGYAFILALVGGILYDVDTMKLILTTIGKIELVKDYARKNFLLLFLPSADDLLSGKLGFDLRALLEFEVGHAEGVGGAGE